eukprot:Gb_21662 [translate_table: standard]
MEGPSGCKATLATTFDMPATSVALTTVPSEATIPTDILIFLVLTSPDYPIENMFPEEDLEAAAKSTTTNHRCVTLASNHPLLLGIGGGSKDSLSSDDLLDDELELNIFTSYNTYKAQNQQMDSIHLSQFPSRLATLECKEGSKKKEQEGKGATCKRGLKDKMASNLKSEVAILSCDMNILGKTFFVVLIVLQVVVPFPFEEIEKWWIPPASAVLYSPDTKVPRTGEVALRKAIPANPAMKNIQDSLEDIFYLLRIPQRKPYGTMEGDVKKALKQKQNKEVTGQLDSVIILLKYSNWDIANWSHVYGPFINNSFNVITCKVDCLVHVVMGQFCCTAASFTFAELQQSDATHHSRARQLIPTFAELDPYELAPSSLGHVA